MWTTIALAMTLAGTPGESGELRLSNIRPTYGLLGSERPNSRLLPGDVFFVTFDIDALKVTVTDRGAKSKESKYFEKKFEVLPPTFGMIRLNIAYDKDGQVPAPHIGVAGQSFYVNFNAVNFERGGDSKDPNIQFEMLVLDERDKPTLHKPIAGC